MNHRHMCRTAHKILLAIVIAASSATLAYADSTGSEDSQLTASDAAEPLIDGQLPALEGMVPVSARIYVWMREFRKKHPGYLAQIQREQGAYSRKIAAQLEFSDPVLTASAGATEEPAGIPNTTFSDYLQDNSIYASAGIEKPLIPGVYGSLGIASGSDLSEGEDGSAQALAGGMIRIPLMRDRMFSINKLEVMGLSHTQQAEYYAGISKLLDISVNVVKAYASWLQKSADAEEIEKAMTRAEKLLEYSTERVRLKDLAEYQIYPARYEATLRREELQSSRQEIKIQEAALAYELGVEKIPEGMPDDPKQLMNWAYALAQCDISDLINADPAVFSPKIQEAKARMNAAKAEEDRTREDIRDSVDLNIGAAWASEDDTSTQQQTGYTISLVYRRPIFKDGARSRVAAATADAKALEHELQLSIINEKTAKDKAVEAFTNSCARLILSRAAVMEAGKVLESEDARFALGDGSSRNVLDAQQDLTTATRRHITVANEVISAMADLRYAIGIMPDDVTITETPQ